jgi:hypothetical protein
MWDWKHGRSFERGVGLRFDLTFEAKAGISQLCLRSFLKFEYGIMYRCESMFTRSIHNIFLHLFIRWLSVFSTG